MFGLSAGRVSTELGNVITEYTQNIHVNTHKAI